MSFIEIILIVIVVTFCENIPACKVYDINGPSVEMKIMKMGKRPRKKGCIKFNLYLKIVLFFTHLQNI